MAETVVALLRGFLIHHGYWAVAATLLLENMGLPVPGETILLLASFLAYSEHLLRLPILILTGVMAATVGDNIGFFIGYRGGRPLLQKYQHLLRMSPGTISRGERAFERLWDSYDLLRAFRVRAADDRRAIGRCLADALEKICSIQLSRCNPGYAQSALSALFERTGNRPPADRRAIFPARSVRPAHRPAARPVSKCSQPGRYI